MAFKGKMYQQWKREKFNNRRHIKMLDKVYAFKLQLHRLVQENTRVIQ